jgi:hypothetical protein
MSSRISQRMRSRRNQCSNAKLCSTTQRNYFVGQAPPRPIRAGKEQITEADLAGVPLIWHMDTSTQPTKRPHPTPDTWYAGWTRDSGTEGVEAGGFGWPRAGRGS